MTPARIKELREKSQAVSKEYHQAMNECLDEIERLHRDYRLEGRDAVIEQLRNSIAERDSVIVRQAAETERLHALVRDKQDFIDKIVRDEHEIIRLRAALAQIANDGRGRGMGGGLRRDNDDLRQIAREALEEAK